MATGVGSMGESTQITKNSNGFKVLSPKYLAAPINDVTIAVNYDFKPMQHYMEGWLVMPGWGTSEYQAKQVSYLRNGTVVFGDEVIGTWNAGKWQNIGVVYHLSSEKGTTIDVWYNGIKKISGFDYSAQKSGICSFVINSIAPHDTSKDTSNRYDGRNEYFIMDNLYIGTDMSCLMDSVVVESSVPEADSEDVSVNTPISVRLNDRAENASAEELISLKSASGETVPLKNFSFDDDRYGISAEYDGILNYRETYTVTLSEAIESQYGYHPVAGAGYSFKTGSAYPGRLTVSNLVKENGTASANVTLSGVEGLLVMASYDDSGAMIEASTAASSGSMSVSCPDGAAVQVFAIDSLASGILIAEPVIENDDASGYYQNNTEITSVEAVGLDKIITISGASSLKNGYVFGKLAKDGKTLSSEAAEDYLGLAAVRTNDKGEFKFTGDVNQTEGTYAYSVRASDMPEAESGSFTYKVKTGKAIESIKLDNTSCDISGSSITMTTSKKDRSGMLVSFILSEGASLYLGSERLDSGKSRINATNQVTLTVVSEWGEAANYSLDVYTSSGSGGSSGGGSGGGSSSNAKISVSSAALTSPPKLADPIEEVTQIFDDVSRDFWAFEAIENLYAKNIISGVTPTTFEPNREITREELAALLQRAFKLSPKGSRLSFDDVPEDAWYADAVYILADNNIIKGVDTHTFGTGQKITRQDMAVMFYRCAAEKLPEKTREYAEFADDTEIAAYAKDAVKAMYECGIINGMEDNNFQPEGCATRAQAAYILNKISG